jgi:gamma-glutamyl-gamma-aminobutyrate hydrolase PuuD
MLDTRDILNRIKDYFFDKWNFEAHPISSDPHHVKTHSNILNLIKDYMQATTNGENKPLSELEVDILSRKMSYEEILSSYDNLGLSNQQGFTLLHLAIITENYELAWKLIQNGHDINIPNLNGITSIDLIKQKDELSESIWLRHFSPFIIENLGNKHVLCQDGGTLLDYIFAYHETLDLIELINEVPDPLIYFFKNDTNPFLPLETPNKTHIAVSHGDHFNPNSIWSTLRLAMLNHEDVLFYVINLEMVNKYGDEFLRQFDGFINPGSPDTFPRNVEKFNNDECSHRLALEKLYQHIAAKSYELNVPYLGICGGAQHMVLYHKGYLGPVDDYFGSFDHTIYYTKGSLSSFFAMTPTEKQKLFNNCEVAEVSFKTSTYNNFAAIADDLGEGIKLEAVSEEGIAMAYSHESGIRYGVQFHPESNYYYSMLYQSEQDYAHERAIVDSFIDLAVMYHAYRVNNGTHPTEYINNVVSRLEECTSKPTCHADLNGEINEFEFSYV